MTETAETMHPTPTRNDLLSNALEAFRSHKEQTTWKSRNTIATNMSPLRTFIRAMGEDIGRLPTTEDLTSERAMRLIRGCWPDTGESYTHLSNFNRVRGFVQWIRLNQYQTGELTVFLDYQPDAPQEIQGKTLTMEEARKTFDINHEHSPRDAWMVLFNMWVCRRPGEVATMKVGDIKLDTSPAFPNGKYIYRETKRGKGLITEKLTPASREVIQGWLEEYRQILGVERLSNDWYLFPATQATGASLAGGKRKRRLIPTERIRDVSAAWARALKAAGVHENKKAGHASRRGGATVIYDALEEIGVPDPMEHVQRVLGHKDRRTTAKYINKDEGKEKTYNALLSIDDIRSGKTPTPEAQPEPVKDHSRGESGGEMAKVIHLPFGRRGA